MLEFNMPARTAYVLTIGDVIESGPPSVTPSNRRNASAPNSPSSGRPAAINVSYKRSMSTSSKVNGRVGGSSRGRSNGHHKHNSTILSNVNGTKDPKILENNELLDKSQGVISADLDTHLSSNFDGVSESENSDDCDLVFTTAPDSLGGKKSGNKIARMKTRHVSTSSAASIVNGNSQPSSASLANTVKSLANSRPKKSIMKSTKNSQDDDEEVSFRLVIFSVQK